MSDAGGWRVAVVVPAAAVAVFEAALADDAVSVTLTGDDPVRIEALRATAPSSPALDLALALAARASGTALPEVVVEPLPARDWLADNRERFAPFRIGRFFVRDPDDTTPEPPGRVALSIEAGAAFGSGRHASTAGCLRAIEALSRRRPPRRVLDVGCGSGILAVAAARAWGGAEVLASDVDPRAVVETRRNAARNGVGGRVRAVLADGYRSPAIRRGAPFNLILANILARPLQRLAADLAGVLAPGGNAILAGFLAADARSVLAAHDVFGLRLWRTFAADGWRTLVLRRTE